MTLTPKKLKTGIGSTVILSCTLMGSPEFTIRWYRNTELVLPDEAVSIRGLSNETLLITSAQKSHSGAYQCFATRKAQTAQDFAIIVLEGELGWFQDSQSPARRNPISALLPPFLYTQQMPALFNPGKILFLMLPALQLRKVR